MAAPSLNVFDTTRLWMGDATQLILPQTSMKVTLHTSTLALTASGFSVYANLTNELSTANGYTNGGFDVGAGRFLTQATTTVKFGTTTAAAWTISGSSIVWRWYVVRAVGTFNGHVDPLICFGLGDSAPADITWAPGAQAINWNANGFFTITGG